MACRTSPHRSDSVRRSIIAKWTIALAVVWAAGVFLLVSLIFWPQIGIHALWDVLIPAAPALVVFAPGVWRNICPLGTTSQLSRRLMRTSGFRMGSQAQAWMALIGIALLLAIVPLRHPWFNVSGVATCVLLVVIGVVALLVGVLTIGKSGWCAGLCPVHAVERLYGSRPCVTVTSSHCGECVKCTTPCPDTSPGIRHGQGARSIPRQISHAVIVGGFPGFVWGWFQVPDGGSVLSASLWLWPFGGLVVTLVLWLLLRSAIPKQDQRRLDALFAAAAVSAYYWFRIPTLIGYGEFGSDGMLVDLRDTIPLWSVNTTKVLLTCLFVWWMVVRKAAPKSWMYRPPPAQTTAKAQSVSISMG
ncbi:MAG: hypothetical protein GY894_05920 [Planctomycetes bacterium]|nr:hypothetical protein [Planctomycetota bacterium]